METMAIVAIVAVVIAVFMTAVALNKPQAPAPKKLGLDALEDLSLKFALNPATVRALMVVANYLGHETSVAEEISEEIAENSDRIIVLRDDIENAEARIARDRARIVSNEARNARLNGYAALLTAPATEPTSQG